MYFKMALVQRSLSFWIFTTVFLILCVFRLDRRTNWLWHLVFIPVWVLDAITMTTLIVLSIMHFKSGHNPYPDLTLGKWRKIWILFLYLLKLIFLLKLCARLDGLTNASYFEVFIPLWILLACVGVDATVATVYSAANPSHRD